MEENLDRTFSRDPYQQMSEYVKQCMGLNLFFKLENPENLRIQKFLVGNQRLNRDTTYRACFVTEQGILQRYGSTQQDLAVNAIDALERYLLKHNRISAGLTGTTAVPI